MRWRFPGSGAWDDWAATRPWNGNGGTVVLEVPRAESAFRLAEEADSSIRSVDQGRTKMWFQRPRHWAATALASVAQWLELPSSSQFEAKQTIANELADAPRLFIVEASLPAALRSQLDELVATTSKLAVGARLVCVLFAVGDGLAPSCLQFVEGDPAEPCLIPSATEGELFARYLHFRVAWESGGRLEVAEALEASLGHAPSASDAELEARFNAFARAADSKLADSIVQREVSNQQVPRGRLVSRLRFPPWVARRMLLLRDARLPQAFLKHRLTCMPLAREITARCFDIESEIRGRNVPFNGASVSTDAGRQWSEFQAGRGLSRTLYPPGAPALPESSWSFTSFGEFLSAVGAKTGGPEHRVRHLRNALSHGHYVSWAAVEALINVERQLALEL